MNKFYFYTLIFFFFASCDSEKNLLELPLDQTSELDNAIDLVKSFRGSLKISDGITRSVDADFNIQLRNTETIYQDIPMMRSVAGLIDTLTLFVFELETEKTHGFAIASGHKNLGRVYAYVENGVLRDTLHNKGMAEMIRAIPDVCREDMYCFDSVYTNITRSSNQDIQYGPYIVTEWDQTSPYNLKYPILDDCGLAYAGCGVIAVAQAIAYYGKYNAYYDFSSLVAQPRILDSSSNYLKNEVSSFIFNVSEALGASYACSGTSTQFKKCYNTLRNMSYNIKYETNPRVKNLNVDKAETSLKNGDIIFMRGSNGDGGHMWIIDGLRFTKKSPRGTKEYHTVHCNFGWNGSGNGWYSIRSKAYVRPEHGGVEMSNYQYNNLYMYVGEYN